MIGGDAEEVRFEPSGGSVFFGTSKHFEKDVLSEFFAPGGIAYEAGTKTGDRQRMSVKERRKSLRVAARGAKHEM